MDKILINIDSRQRNIDTYENSNFFRINLPINFKNIAYAKLSSFEVANLFYVFTEARKNTFFRIKNILDPSYTTITIPDGNYTINNLKVALNNALITAGFIDVEFSYSLSTKIFTISRIVGVNSYSILWSNDNYEYNSLGYYLGFRSDITLNNVITSVDALYQVDLVGEKYFFVRINDWGNIYIGSKPERVLAKIILTSYKQDFIFDNFSNYINKTCKFRQPENINKLEIELLDSNGHRFINGNLDYSLTLEIGEIYDEQLYQQSLNYLDIDENIIHAKLLEIYPETALKHDYLNNNEENDNDIVGYTNQELEEIEPIKEDLNKKILNNNIISTNNEPFTNIETKRKMSRRKKKKHYKINY